MERPVAKIGGFIFVARGRIRNFETSVAGYDHFNRAISATDNDFGGTLIPTNGHRSRSNETQDQKRQQCNMGDDIKSSFSDAFFGSVTIVQFPLGCTISSAAVR